MEIVIAFSVVLLLYGLFSKRLTAASITPYIVFVTVGIVLGLSGVGFFEVTVDSEVFIVAGELALALTLFNDASRIDLKALRGSAALPLRLLAIGMPLTIALGTVAAALLLGLPLLEAALVGAVLAPTDAGLGQAVVTSPKVPLRIRQALNVESGLNDGIATPLVIGLIALTEAETQGGYASVIVSQAVRQIGIGIVVGLVLGLLVGWLSKRSRTGMLRAYRWLAIPTMALLAYGVADLLGGNGFISAFAAGLALAWAMGGLTQGAADFSESVGLLFVLAVFFFFGVLTAGAFRDMGWEVWAYVALSLTVVRMVPVALSMLGSKLSAWSTGFMGWFGPRGLASIVLGLIVFQDALSEYTSVIVAVVAATVVVSVYVHGATAVPLVRGYERHADELDEDAPENEDVVEVPTRGVTPGSTEGLAG
jgi:NhaP-type Na+/H+ or K+/H+ antiporter